MKLLEFSFSRDPLERFTLNPIVVSKLNFYDLNLLVGKNASGKTTIINLLGSVLQIFYKTTPRYIGKFNLKFSDDNQNIYEYFLNGDVEGILEEYLKRNEDELIRRNSKEAKIYSSVINDFETINPPKEQLVIQARRDEKAYPYLEIIAKWSQGIHFYKFGHVHSNRGFAQPEIIGGVLQSLKDTNIMLSELNEETKKVIIEEFNSLDYQINLLEIRKQGVQGTQNVLYIKEDNFQFEIAQHLISQGMYRSLSLLIFINYLIEKENTQLVIIDDFCESLDYDRATLLGKIVFDKMLKNGIQFIATSNDYFLMNSIDIKYWNIIYRNGNNICSMNHSNSKTKFEEFKFTGLNNFDLFSSTFLYNDKNSNFR